MIDRGTTDPYHYWWAGRSQVVENGCPAAVEYLRAGWELAKDSSDQIIVDSYVDQMRSCQLFIDPLIESTQEAESTPEATIETGGA